MGQDQIRLFRNKLTETGTLRRVMKAFDWQLQRATCRCPARSSTPPSFPHLSSNNDAEKEAIRAGKSADEIWPDEPNKAAQKDDTDLGSWINRAVGGLVATFGRGVIKDEAAVRAAIKLPWSNGQTEGQITKLKLVKRQMYGRGKIDLLQARLIGALPC